MPCLAPPVDKPGYTGYAMTPRPGICSNGFDSGVSFSPNARRNEWSPGTQVFSPTPISAEIHPTNPTPRSKVAFHYLPRGTDGTQFIWINVVQPNAAIINWLVKEFSIQERDLRSSMNENNTNDSPTQSYRYKDYLVNSYTELTFDSDNPLKVKELRVLGVLGNHFLITIAPSNTTSCETVTREIKGQSLQTLEIGSSNHLFSRLLGSSLHVNEHTADILARKADDFVTIAPDEGPSPERRREFAALKRSIIETRRALQAIPEVISSLKEDRNMFGATGARSALERYEVIHTHAMDLLVQSDEVLSLAQDDWRITQDEHRNGILFRLAVLGGALSPTALVTSIFGMNFPSGLPYSSSTMALAIGASVAASLMLVGPLLFKRAFPHCGRSAVRTEESGTSHISLRDRAQATESPNISRNDSPK